MIMNAPATALIYFITRVPRRTTDRIRWTNHGYDQEWNGQARGVYGQKQYTFPDGLFGGGQGQDGSQKRSDTRAPTGSESHAHDKGT